MPPLKKVKARNCNLISEEDQQNFFDRRLCSDAAKGTIPFIDVPEPPSNNVLLSLFIYLDEFFRIFFVFFSSLFFTSLLIYLLTSLLSSLLFDAQQLCSEDFKLNRSHALQKNGSKQAPFKIADFSPKPSLVSSFSYLFFCPTISFYCYHVCL